MNPRSDDHPIGVFAIVVKSKKILLIKRGNRPHKGNWCLPGGVIDKGESPEDAAIRETLEETGIKIKIVSFLGEIVGPLTGRIHYIYLCTQKSGMLNSDSPEVDEVEWIQFEDINNYQIPTFIMEFLDTVNIHELGIRGGN